MIKAAKRKIGLSPVTTDHIRHWVSEDLKGLNTAEEFNTEQCSQARLDAAYDYLRIELKYKDGEINIKKPLWPNQKVRRYC